MAGCCLSRQWLPRGTGMPIDEFGGYVLLTNFENYCLRFRLVYTSAENTSNQACFSKAIRTTSDRFPSTMRSS